MFSTSLGSCPRVLCLQALIHGALASHISLFFWKITRYPNITKGSKKCILVDRDSPYPVTPINIQQPAELTLGNIVHCPNGSDPRRHCLNGRDPKIHKPLNEPPLRVINTEALKHSEHEVLWDEAGNVGGSRAALVPGLLALKECTARPRWVKHPADAPEASAAWC